MISARVWEAVAGFNTRTSIGRVVVNPPEKRGEVKARPTLEAWYFCKCGKAFSNPDSYVVHRKTHMNENISLQVSYVPSPSPSPKKEEKKEKVRDTVNRKVLKKLSAGNLDVGRKVENDGKELRRAEAHSPVSPAKKIKVVRTPKGIKSIKGIRLHLKSEDRMRNMKSAATPTPQRLQSNIHRCNQCNQVFILAAHLRIHTRLKHTPSLMSNMEPLVVSQPEVRIQKLDRPVSIHRKMAARRLIISRRVKANDRCETCKVTFTSRIGYFQHVKMAHGGRGLLSCPHCPKKTLNADALRSHINLLHEFPESTSNVTTRSTGKKVQEETTTDGEAKLEAVSQIPFSFDNLKSELSPEDKSKVTSTRSGCHRKLPFVVKMRSSCKICSKSFHSSGALKAHMIQKHRSLKEFSDEHRNQETSKIIPEVVDVREQHVEKSSDMNGYKSSFGNDIDKEDKNLFYDAVGTRTRSRLPTATTSTSECSINEVDLTLAVMPELITSQNDPEDMETSEKPNVETSNDFICVSCNIAFESRRSLGHHTREQHPIEGKFKCEVCCFQCSTFNRLTTHKLRHSKAPKLKTSELDNLKTKNITGSISNSLEAAKLDNDKMSDQRNSFSKDSPIKLRPRKTNINTVNVLLDQKELKGMWSCNLCKKQFSHSFSLSQHLKNHSSPFLCDVCGIGFTVQENLDLHNSKAHFPGGQYACKICPCIYENYRGLASHIAHRHHQKSSSKSGEKGNQTISREDLICKNSKEPSEKNSLPKPTSDDIICETSDQQHLTVCKLCGCQILNDLYDLHLKEAHAESGQFRCPDCTCAFMSRQGLSSHKREFHFYKTKNSTLKSVSNELKLSSTLDGRINSRSLRQNQNQSKDVKRAEALSSKSEWSSCTLCRLSIPGGDKELQKHLQIAHVTPSAFRCQHCSCSFRDKDSLIIHMTNVVHPVKCSQDTPLMAQSIAGTVQVIPHLRPVIPEATSLNAWSTPDSQNQKSPWKYGTANSCEKVNESAEDNVPKIINCYSQNPDFVKHSPQKLKNSDEPDVVFCKETGPIRVSVGCIEDAIEAATRTLKAKDIHEVNINGQVSLSIAKINGIAPEESRTAKDTSLFKLPNDLTVMKKGKSKSRKQQKMSLLPPPPIELSELSTEYQLPFTVETLEAKPDIEVEEVSFKKKLRSRSSVPANAAQTEQLTQELFSKPILKPIPPKISMATGPAVDLTKDVANEEWSSWSLSTLLGTCRDDEEQLNAATPNDPIEITPTVDSSEKELKTTNQNSSRLSTCSFCKKSFFSQQKLMRHMQLHIDQKNKDTKPGGKCGYCGQNFDVHAALWAHLKECRVVKAQTAGNHRVEEIK